MLDVRFLNQILNAIVYLAVKELTVVCIQHQLDFVTSFHLNAHEIHRPATEIHEEHGWFVLQQPGHGHKGGIALGENGDFIDGDTVLHTLKLEIYRLPASQQIIPEPRLVASETGQRQPRRNPHRTFGRQTSLPNFFGNGSQHQQIVVVVHGLISLDGLPPSSANKKAPGKFQKTLPGVGFVFSVACKPCRERAVRRFDGVIAVVDANNNAHGNDLLSLIVYDII